MPTPHAKSHALKEAIAHHRQGDLNQAEAGYRRVLELDPEQPDALHLLGVLSHQRGDSETAIRQIRRSLAINEGQPGAHNNLGNVLAACGRLEEAIASYDRAIALRPADAQPRRNRGRALAELHRQQEAIASYRQVLRLQPDDVVVRRALAALCEDQHELEEACQQWQWLAENSPPSPDVYLRWGTILRKMGRLDAARDAYRRCLELDPDQPIARHFLAACGGESVPPCAAADYVRTTFDGFASEYDACLERLGYRVPELLADVLTRFPGSESPALLDIADLGCGTGLCGPQLRRRARRLVGVDLSAPMLDRARERGLYDELVEGELTHFLRLRPAAFDLLVSADTLVYFGEVADVLEAARQSLRSGGGLVFTVEKLEESGEASYRLNRFGRYLHRESYLRASLEGTGLDVVSISEEVLRLEAGLPVNGLLVAAQRR